MENEQTEVLNLTNNHDVLKDAVKDMICKMSEEKALYGSAYVELKRRDGKVYSIAVVTERELAEAQYGKK